MFINTTYLTFELIEELRTLKKNYKLTLIKTCIMQNNRKKSVIFEYFALF